MHIVMISKEKMPGSCWGKYSRIAVVKVVGSTRPTQIHPGHRSVLAVVEEWRRQFSGVSTRCAAATAKRDAEALANRLNQIEARETASLTLAGY